MRPHDDGPTAPDSAVLAGVPDLAGVQVPAVVRRLASTLPIRPVWRNELDGLTIQLGDDADPRRSFVKWQPPATAIDLAREAGRLVWARQYTTVPQVIDHGTDGTATWLHTAAVPGENAVTPRWLADPVTAVAAIGAGLRALHERLPVAECPFSWSADERRDRAGSEARRDPAQRHGDHRGPDYPDAVARLADAPPIDRLVVCHGDACAPNTLIGDDGTWSAHVDLGSLGVADRWADLAIATWSTQWNYGPGWEDPLLAAYGIAPDPERTAYYRRLWELSP